MGVVFLFYLLLGLVLAAGLIWAANRGTALLRQLPQLWNSVLGHLLPQLESLFSSHLPLAAWGTATLEHTLSGWISRISGRVAALAARWLRRLPVLLLGSVFTILLSFYAAADYPRLCSLLRRRISPEKIAVLKKTPSLCRTGAAADAPDLGDPFSDAAGDSDCGPVAAPGAPPPVRRRAHHPV